MVPDFTSDAAETRSSLSLVVAGFFASGPERSRARACERRSCSLDGEDRCVSSNREGKRAAKKLKRDDFQIRDAIEVARIVGADRVAEFQSARADDQIDEGQIDSFSRLFSTNARDDFRCGFRDRMDGNVCLQFIDKLAAAFSTFGRVSAVDAVSEFCHGHHGDDDRRIADISGSPDIAEHFRRRELGPFRRNQNARIED